MILAVTGITGHTGQFFIKELENHEFDGTVRCLVRKSSNTEHLDKSQLHIEKIYGDVNNYKNLLSLTQDSDMVMHIYNIHNSVDVFKAVCENHVPRLVMVHTTGVYSKFKMAGSEYKEIEKEVETLLKVHPEVDCTILRPTMIFGDMCDRNISEFIRMADKYPIMPEIDKGRGKIQPVNARDLAEAYYKVIMTDHLPELYYDLSGEKSLSLHELFDLIGENLKKRIHHLSCPIWLGSAGTRCVKAMTLGKVDFVERVLRMGEDRDYNHDKATRDFGYFPEMFETGLKREVEEYLRGRA